MSARVLVDADACPVKEIIVAQAKRRRIPVVMFIDVNHEIHDGYSEVIVVDQGRDSVDFKLIAAVKAGDVVVTQDYGVAAIALSKKARVLHQSGMLFTQSNIDGLLNDRYENQKSRRAGKRACGPKKRTRQEDERFDTAFGNLLDSL